MYLAWGGDTLDVGGGITLMRDARSWSGAEEEERVKCCFPSKVGLFSLQYSIILY